MSNLDKENFSTFNEMLFSDEVNSEKYKFHISPRENMRRIRDKSNTLDPPRRDAY